MPAENFEAEGSGEFAQADSVLVEWAAEVADRIRAGEPVDLEELARQHPDRTDALRRLLPAIALMADLARSSRGDGSGPRARTPEADPDETLPPELADRPDCVIQRELGRGGMGVVYLAHNTLLGRDEVLKVIGRRVSERPGMIDRFLREIRAVARLRHPNIVTAYHAARVGEGVVFAMEHVHGLDLARLVKARGPMPVAFACGFARQAALGLEHAHEQGLVHRDIKPGNLMLAREGDRTTVKILDFGLAKVAREERVDGGLTDERQALGTPGYMAPEQIVDASSADIRADIYSLGCTLYYLLSGRPPFQASSLYDIYQAHISRDADPLDAVRPAVPAELAALVAKMMAKDPAQRFQTPGEVARALEPFLTPGDVAFRNPGADPTSSDGPWEDLLELRQPEAAPQAAPAVAPRRRPPWLGPAVAAALLVLFGAFAALILGVVKVKTPDGTIVLENVPKDSEVLVDGHKITFTWPGGGKPVLIRAVPGQRKVEVKSEGFKTFGEVVTVQRNAAEALTVRLEPLATVRSGKRPAPPANRQGWVSLFNGKDLSGWFVDSGMGANWRVEGGDLVVTGPGDWRKNGFLLSVRDYSDFDLRFEFQAPPRSNSGVTFRAVPDQYVDPEVNPPLQVELVDRHDSYKVGSFLWPARIDDTATVLPNWPAKMKPAGEWNTMEIQVEAGALRVSVNGEAILRTDLAALADRPDPNPALKRRSGRIGFQSHTGTVRFRNIEIKELGAGEKVTAITGPAPFVVLGGKGVAECTFATLIEAVQASSDGDTIEVRGNGPFVTKQVDVGHALTIRAAAGFRPVIRLSPEVSDTRAALITTQSPLVLEGLELWGTRLRAAKPGAWTVVLFGSPLHIANCRLVSNGSNRMFQAGVLTRLTNCEFLAELGPEWVFSEKMGQVSLTIDNCLLVGMNLILTPGARGVADRRVQFMRSTYTARDSWFRLTVPTPPGVRDQDHERDAVVIDVSQSIICCGSSVDYRVQAVDEPQARSLKDVDAYLRRIFRWRGESNVYHLSTSFLSQNLRGEPGAETWIHQLDQWRRFTGSPETGCIQGSVKFQGGDLRARATHDPEHLKPDDFRLRPDSIGYRAGPDGKDLGADIDLVGPGPAYERWKATPAYQEWLKDAQRAHQRFAQAVRQNAPPDPVWGAERDDR